MDMRNLEEPIPVALIHSLLPDDSLAIRSLLAGSTCPLVIHSPFAAKRAVEPTLMQPRARQLTPECGKRTEHVLLHSEPRFSLPLLRLLTVAPADRKKSENTLFDMYSKFLSN